MSKKSGNELKRYQRELLKDQKKLQRQVSLRMKIIRERCSKGYVETGYEIEKILANEFCFRLIDNYIDNDNLDLAEKYLHFLFRDYIYMFEDFEIEALGDDVIKLVEFVKRVLPVLVQIKVRETVLQEVDQLIKEDLEDLKSMLRIEFRLFKLEKNESLKEDESVAENRDKMKEVDEDGYTNYVITEEDKEIDENCRRETGMGLNAWMENIDPTPACCREGWDDPERRYEGLIPEIVDMMKEIEKNQVIHETPENGF